MLTKEQEPTEPWGERTDTLVPRNLIGSPFFFVFALLFMCISEGLVVHGLWFSANPHFSVLKRLKLPLVVMMPGLMGFVLFGYVAKMSKVGQVSLSAAAQLKFSLGMMLMIVYLAILDLAEIAFG